MINPISFCFSPLIREKNGKQIRKYTEMKNTIIKKITIIAMMLLSVGLFAQTPPHPNSGGAPGNGNTPVGGGAPIDGGITIMLILGTAYALKGHIAPFRERDDSL
jgi:hypothetical protein